jgi:extracellular factor (EF) 3-hydroxypalmitic acid methyl ester biosynthesis protein
MFRSRLFTALERSPRGTDMPRLSNDPVSELPSLLFWRRTRQGVHRLPFHELAAAVESFKEGIGRAELALASCTVDECRADRLVREVFYEFVETLQAYVAAHGPLSDETSEYVFREASPLASRSAFMHRCITKPRGYAGDFLTVDAMYLNEASGDGRLGR